MPPLLLLCMLLLALTTLVSPASVSSSSSSPIPAARAWPAWVITLARTPGRLARFKRSSHAYEEFPRLEEFPAVDGRTLNVVTERRISSRSRVRSRDTADRRSHSDLQTLGMAGLYISHVEVWRAFLDSGEEVGLVLEDDAVVARGLGDTIDAAVAASGLPPPDTWDVWLVGALALRSYTPIPPTTSIGGSDSTASSSGSGSGGSGSSSASSGGSGSGGSDSASSSFPTTPGWSVVQDWWGTQAYLLTRRGAAHLLAHAYPADAQIDAYMAQMATLGEVRVLSYTGVDIPQFPWYTLGGTTVQLYAIYCDACDLPNNFSMGGENAWWRGVGVVLGVLGVLAWRPFVEARKRALAAGWCTCASFCCRRKDNYRTT